MKSFRPGFLSTFFAAFFLAACSNNAPLLKGDRLPVLSNVETLSSDESAKNHPIEILDPILNNEWAQAAFVPNHLVPHLKLPEKISLAWDRSIGKGTYRGYRLLTTPILVHNKIYCIDSYGVITALDKEKGKLLWRFRTAPPKENAPFANGGLAYDQGKIFAATGFAQLIAIDAETGKEIWRQNLSAPLRSSPSVSDGRVFAITIDNTIFALSQHNGNILWNHSGIMEHAGLLGGASPAISNDLIVGAFSSGEIIGFKAETGRPLWGEAITSLRRTDSVSNISSIRAHPVIDQNRVFVVGHGGRMFALDTKTGEQLWERPIGGIDTPFVHNDFIYVLSTQSELVCLNKENGSVIWIKELPRLKPKTTIPIIWFGPILAGYKLYLTNTLGELWALSPKDGTMLDGKKFNTKFNLPPIVVGEVLYLLSDNGKLFALK